MKVPTFVILFVLVLAGALAYSNTLQSELVWDDHYLVKDNVYIKRWSHALDVFKYEVPTGTGKRYNFYRPLQMLTYMADYSLWKLNPLGYHLTNVILHLLATLALYLFIYALFGDRFIAFLSGLFFVIHPVHTEAVAYISGRADPLALLWMLLCLVFYVRQQKAPTFGKYMAMLFCYTLALISRENSLILPALILLYHYSFKKKIIARNFLPLSALALLYLVLRLALLRSLLPHLTSTTTLFNRLPGFMAALVNYVQLLFYPHPLHMEYANPPLAFGDIRASLGAVFFFALVVIIYGLRRKKSEAAFFGLAWFLISLLPMSNLYPINAYMAEHWLYVPSIGFFLILAKGIKDLSAQRNWRIPVVLITAGLAGVYFYLTLAQNKHWQKAVSFYQYTLRQSPGSLRMLNGLGLAYYADGKTQEAIAALEKAIENNPNDADAYCNLGLIYQEQGWEDRAIPLLERAVELNPYFAKAYNNLGVVYQNRRENAKAIELFEQAIRYNPVYPKANYNLGNAYADAGEWENAARYYQQTIYLDPDYVQAYYNLGNAYYQQGQFAQAEDAYEEAIELKADYIQAYNNLAVIYADRKDYNQAINMFKLSTALGPNFAPTYFNLGNVYRSGGNNEEAIKAYKQAIVYNPAFSEAYFNLGNTYLAVGNNEEAMTAYKNAINNDPNNAQAYNNLAILYYQLGQFDQAIEYCDLAKVKGMTNNELLDALEPHRKK